MNGRERSHVYLFTGVFYLFIYYLFIMKLKLTGFYYFLIQTWFMWTNLKIYADTGSHCHASRSNAR